MQNDGRVEPLERSTVYDGYFRVDRYRLRHKLFAGGWSEEITREVFERGHAAAVLPYDPLRDAVVLIEQFRVGAYAAGLDPWVIEAVGGIIEAGESPEQVARREAEEEAGCTITALEPIGRVFSSPGGCSETLSLFCGRVDAAGPGGLFGLTQEQEDIRAFTLSREAALERLAKGEIINATAVIVLQWLALNHGRLRRIWS